MHLKFFSDSLPPTNSAAAARADILVKSLQTAGIKVLLFSSSAYPQSQSLFFKTASNKSSFAIRLLFEILAGVELSLRLLLSHLHNPGPVYLSSPPFITCSLAATILALFRIPYLIEVRDPYPEVYFQHKLLSPQSWLGKLAKAYVKFIYQYAQHIFVATEGIKQIITTYGIDLNKITLVKNGFDENTFQPNPKPTAHSPFVCVFHGNLGHMQNVDLLLKISEQVNQKNPSIQFIVAGSGPQASKLTNKLTNQLNSNTPVQFLGDTPFQEIPKILQKAHLGLSFRHDGKLGQIALPVKVFEYIGAGLPTIITPPSEMGHILEAKQLGWQFENNQTNQITDKICELADSVDTYATTKKNVLAQRHEFSRQKQANIFVKKISELLS